MGAHNSVVGADQGLRAPSGDQESVRDSVHEDSASARIAARQRPRPSFRHPHAGDPAAGAAKRALRALARRHRALTAEIKGLDAELLALCERANPALLGTCGVGAEVASALLVAAGDNPQRMRSEASFAALCGASPIEASSGPRVRHRLNRGGNR